ncbi:MAG TPA: cytochrome c-type biogenesis protein [Longimicrobiales bacterium]
MKHVVPILTCLTFALGMVIATSARAQTPGDSALEAQTRAVASHLRCPVCQGLSIQDSPSELSQQMKSIVREQLRAGKSPAEVKAYFVSKYGEWILLEPKPSGMNLAVYVAPFILLLGGGALIVVMVRRWTARPPVEPAQSETESEPETVA